MRRLLTLVLCAAILLSACSNQGGVELPRKKYEVTPIPTEPAYISANDVTRFCYEYETQVYDLSIRLTGELSGADEIELASRFSECRNLITSLRKAISVLTAENDYQSGAASITQTDDGLLFDISLDGNPSSGTLEGAVLLYSVYAQDQLITRVKLMKNDTGLDPDWFCFVYDDKRYYYIEVGDGVMFCADTDENYQNPAQTMTYDEGGNLSFTL